MPRLKLPVGEMASRWIEELRAQDRMNETEVQTKADPTAQEPKKGPKNPVVDTYGKITNGEAAKWILAMVCFGLSTVIITKISSGPLRSIAAYFIATVCISQPMHEGAC